MTEKMKLKRATAGDIEDVLAVEKSLAGMKVYSATIERDEALEEITGAVFYLIEIDGKVAGDISYQIKDKDHAYFQGLAIMPEFQGKGIARKATEMVLEELKDIKIIDLVTHPENQKAINLYASFGFKKVGAPKENYFDDGEPRIEMILER